MPLSIWYAAINDALHMHSPPSRSAGGRPVGRGEVEGRIVGAAWTRRSISATGRVWTRARTCRISQLSGRPEAAIQAFGAGSERANHVKLAVLIGSLLAATLATVVLRIRNGVYRRIEEAKPPMTTPTACPTSTDLHDPHMAAAMSTF